MKNTQELLTEISTYSRKIEENYPELQKYLDETRSTLPNDFNASTSINNEDLQNYLNQLKEMVEKYKKKY